MIVGTYDKIMARLEEWERKEGGLPPFVRYYRELLQIQSKAHSRISVTRSGLDIRADERLSRGIPLLLFGEFSPDWGEVQNLFEQVSVWAGRDSKTPLRESDRLRKISHNRQFLTKLAETWYLGHFLNEIAAAESLDGELLTSITAATLMPFLAAYARLLLPEVEQEMWRRRYCPVCGGSPDFAYLDREKGARWLVCSRCDADWLFLRLECPYCGTQDQNALAYFTDERETSLYRLYVCKKCHAYIKAVDLRRAGYEVLLPLERIMTIDLDRQALEDGYKPGMNNPGVAVG